MGSLQSQKFIIDYIITRQETTLKIQKARVKRGLNCESDHFTLMVRLYINLYLIRIKINISDLKELFW